jgi:hypothetical protein
VATTRKDGAMLIEVDASGRWTIERVSVRDWPRTTAPMSSAGLGLGGLPASSFGGSHFATNFGGLLSGLPVSPPSTKSDLGLFGLLNSSDDPLSRALGLGPFLAPSKR